MRIFLPHAIRPIPNKTLFLLVAALLCFTASAWADETEVTPIKRIRLEANIDRNEAMRVMLYSNEFSLYPKLTSGPIYLSNQAPPGVSGGAAALGTIIGMMFVNKMNASERETALQFKRQIDHALAELDIKSELKNALATELQKEELSDHLEFESVVRGHELAQPGLLTRITEKNILTLATAVSFDAELRAICIRGSAKLWRKDQTKPLYYSELNYASQRFEETGLKDLRARWSSDNGEMLRSRIKEGLAEIAHMLLLDLKTAPNVDESSLLVFANLEVISPFTGKKIKTSFHTVEENSERLIGRPDSPDSSLLMSLPRQQ